MLTGNNGKSRTIQWMGQIERNGGGMYYLIDWKNGVVLLEAKTEQECRDYRRECKTKDFVGPLGKIVHYDDGELVIAEGIE